MPSALANDWVTVAGVAAMIAAWTLSSPAPCATALIGTAVLISSVLTWSGVLVGS